MSHNIEQKVFWTILELEGWSIPIAATSNGLCYTGPSNSEFEELRAWVAKRMPTHLIERNDDFMQPFATELVAYLSGNSTSFTLPQDLHGTSFQLEVWSALLAIPFGQTVCYSDIAERIGRPQSVRAVGTAIGANPILITVPCHRVLANSGQLAGFRGGLEMKKQLLELEKCSFKE